MITKIEVTRVFQVKIGILHIVIPGARIVMMVVMKLTPPRMVPNPLRARPNTHKSPPIPGENVVLESGAYANQPKDAAPCGVKNPETAMKDPKLKNQYAIAFNLGNATSGAPIWTGINTFANPAKSGVANIKSMIVPCIVNNWLYCSLVATMSRPGRVSCARIISAITPPIRKYMNEVIRYR